MNPDDLDLAGEPVLVVGWRPKAKKLAAAAVDLNEDTFDIAREIANQTLYYWQGCAQVNWHPDANVEEGEEILVLPAEELPATHPDEHAGDPQLAETAQLLSLVLFPGRLETLEPGQLADGRFRFCAVVWEDGLDGRPVAIVAEHDPTFVLRRASHWFRFEGTLKATTPPDFTLPSRGDLIVTEEEIFIHNPATFDRLFSDVRALLNDVPAATAALQASMARLPMTEATAHALEEVCGTRPSLARRLQRLANHPVAQKITADELRPVVEKHGEDATDYLTEDALDLAPHKVRAWLDLVEGRWYEADFSNEPRRAAKWSAR